MSAEQSDERRDPPAGALPVPYEPVRPGERALGRYELVYRVAHGGMATVYLARVRGGEGFEKWVAVKLIHPHLSGDPKFVRLFLREARLAARISHPNACSVFDYGEADGQHYLAMEYLHGESLRSILSAAESSPGVPRHLAARIVADVARGLHAAHEIKTPEGALANVVHRDISPENIFVLYDGVSKVVDFGVARWSEDGSEGTRSGELRGKLSYMAPEQARAEAVDRRTDVFALGIVLWEATLHRRLFRRDNDAARISAVLSDPIPRPTEIDPGYPAGLESIVMRALSRDRDGRYPTADALARDLDAFLARCGEPAGAIQVADFLAATFPERLRARGDALERAARGELMAPTSRPRDGDAVERTATVTTGGTSPSGAQTPITPTVTVGAARGAQRPSRRPIALLALLALGAVAAGAIAFRARMNRVTPAPARAETAPARSTEVPPVIPAASPVAVAPVVPPPAAATNEPNRAPRNTHAATTPRRTTPASSAATNASPAPSNPTAHPAQRGPAGMLRGYEE